MTVEQVINECQVCPGNCIKLPAVQLDRKIYEQVAKKLQGIGGAWKGGKVAAFVFPFDPTERLSQIQDGETVNLKKDFQFFETPAALADELVRLADIKDDDRVLEPSAGRGAIIQAIRRKSEYCHISAVELMPENAAFLKTKKLAWNIVFDEDNFLTWDEGAKPYDKIIANPPFSKNQDIDHVYAMWADLKPGGRLVSIMSKHWQFSGNSKESHFRSWLEAREGGIIDVPAGTFKESGTGVSSVIVIIDKLGL